MLVDRKEQWKLRAAFIRAVKTVKTNADYIRIYQADANYYLRSYLRNQVERDYYWDRYRNYANLVETERKRVKLAKWLLNCGLYPHINGDRLVFCPKGRNRRKVFHLQFSTFQRFIQRNAPADLILPPEQLDKFCGEILRKCTPLKCRLLTGKDVSKAYANFVGGKSCMCGEHKNDFVSLYETNPDIVGMILVGPNPEMELCNLKGTVSRALVWKTSKGIIIDRIYFGDLSSIAAEVQQTAKTYLTKQNPDIPVYFTSEAPDVTVKVKAPASDKWPYCDTFHWVTEEPDGRGLYTMANEASLIPRGERMELDNTDGTGPGSNRPCCDNCGERYSEDEYGGDGMCQECFDDCHTGCEHCGETVHVDNTVMVNVCSRGRTYEQTWCEGCYDADGRECDNCSERYRADELERVSTEHDDEEWCPGCMDADSVECAGCGENYAHQACHTRNDEERCPTCTEEFDAEAEELAALQRRHNPSFVFVFINVLAA